MMAKLSEKAMLVNFSVGMWTGSRKDQPTSTEVTRSKNADDDAAAVWVKLVPPSSVKVLQSMGTKARNSHKAMTLPWTDGGCRILPAKRYLAYTKKMRELEAEYRKEIDTFLSQYTMLVADAPRRLGDMYDATKLPTVEDLRSRFHWDVQVFPLPEATDFRIDINDEVNADAKKEVEESLKRTTAAAMRHVWDKLYTVVENMAKTLKDADKTFRDSLVGNIVKICETLPDLNLTDDKELEVMRKDVLKQLANAKPEELRDDKNERKETAKKAADILAKMNKVMKGK